jgi:predicted metal-dependent HD superfamily phosphohydrolase
LTPSARHTDDGCRLRAWPTVEPALWFQDAVCNPGAVDNEDRRAATFAAAARGRLSQDLIATVRRLILATKHHAPAADVAHRVLLDCDLAALGRNRKAFEGTSAAIRRECSSLTEDRFVDAAQRAESPELTRRPLSDRDHASALRAPSSRQHCLRLAVPQRTPPRRSLRAPSAALP